MYFNMNIKKHNFYKKQNVLVKKMALNQCSKEEIEETLNHKFEEEAIESSTINQKMRLVCCGNDVTSKHEYHSEGVNTQFTIEIQQILEEFLFFQFICYLVEILQLTYPNLITGDQK